MNYSTLSFSELEFKWSVHVIDTLNQLHVSILDFLTVSHYKSVINLYHDSNK